jgi:2-C-methyl-D-erythritol 4-phosphate cytidylyltransferase
VVDTLKEVDERGASPAPSTGRGSGGRRRPQGFPRAMLDEAHARARATASSRTDDAALCERLGYPVEWCRRRAAMKVTDAGDFARAEALSILPG